MYIQSTVVLDNGYLPKWSVAADVCVVLSYAGTCERMEYVNQHSYVYYDPEFFR